MTHAGTECPYCACRASMVRETNPVTYFFQGRMRTFSRRRRQCLGCRMTYFTWEVAESIEVDPRSPVTMRNPLDVGATKPPEA